MKRRTCFLAVASSCLLILAVSSDLGAQDKQLRIFQNAEGGDHVSVIDPTTNTVVAEIPIEGSHGLSPSPDGTRVYATGIEEDHVLYVVDTKTMKVTHKVPTTGRTGATKAGPDGRRIYVAIVGGETTGMDIIDAQTLTHVRNLPLAGMQPHYVSPTPDGKYIVATVTGGRTAGRGEEGLTVHVVNAETETLVRSFVGSGTGGHRVCDFYPNSDGSTKWFMCNQGGHPGFVVYDFDTGEIVQKITLPRTDVWSASDARSGVQMPYVRSSRGSPSHGLAVSPDRKMVVVSDRWYNMVHFYSAPGTSSSSPDFKHLFAVRMGPIDPFWFAFTPDSKQVYVSGAVSETVSVIDIEQRREVVRIPLQGPVAKRIIAAMVPVN